jgi:flavorubredoxin
VWLKQYSPSVRSQLVLMAIAGIIPPERLRYIGFSHFEADECG